MPGIASVSQDSIETGGLEFLLPLGIAIIVVCIAIYAHRLASSIRSADITCELSLQEANAARETLQAALTDRDELLESLNKSAIVSVTDPSGIITYANDKFCELSGYSREELLGADHRIVNSGTHPKQFWAAMFRVAMSGETWRDEVKNRSKDGTIYWVDSSVRAVLDTEGKLKEFVAVRVDITERKAQERELQHTNEELLRAKIDAEAANKAKSLFLANMSHEIRTPMTAILGHVDLMLEPDQPDQNHLMSVEVIHRNADHLMSLIGDVLDLSKIEASELDLEESLSNPASIAEDVMSLLRPRAKDNELALTLEYDTPVPREILTDPYRLRQILQNLVTNAIKFTSDGSVTLSVALDNPYNPSPMLRFCVRDTGIGINADQIAHLFKPFSQADASTTRQFGGSGLGLAISQRLAHALGGDIDVESLPGHGSAFTLSIPVNSSITLELVTSRYRQDQPPACPPAKSHTLDGRILLVEDGPDNQRLIAHHLRRAGAKVQLAENGQVAVESYKAAPGAFDLILMDMQMPIMDGYQATRTLKALGVAIPIVALTAHAMAGDRQLCIDAGCDDYLTKPITQHTLVESCAFWLDDARMQRAV